MSDRGAEGGRSVMPPLLIISLDSFRPCPRFEFVKVYSDKLVSRTIITRIPLGDLRYYTRLGFKTGYLEQV